MSDLIRDAPVGQLIRYFTGNRYLQYPEERQGFDLPSCYYDSTLSSEKASDGLQTTSLILPSPSNDDTIDLEKANVEEKEPREGERNLSLARTLTDGSRQSIRQTDTDRAALCPVSSRIALEKVQTRADLEQAFADAILVENESPRPVEATKLDDGTVLVDWYSTADDANPQNWSTGKKAFVTFLICLYTTGVYSGSAIYAPSETGVMERFNVGPTAAALGLALYVLAYGEPLAINHCPITPIVQTNVF